METKCGLYQYFTKDEAKSALERVYEQKIIRFEADLLEKDDEKHQWHSYKKRVHFILDDGWEYGYGAEDNEIACYLLNREKFHPNTFGILSDDGILVFDSYGKFSNFLINDNVKRAVKCPLEYTRSMKYLKSIEELNRKEDEEISDLTEEEINKIVAEEGAKVNAA